MGVLADAIGEAVVTVDAAASGGGRGGGAGYVGIGDVVERVGEVAVAVRHGCDSQCEKSSGREIIRSVVQLWV